MLRKTLMGLVAVAVVSIAAQQAQAGWRHHHGWGSSGGSWGSCGSSGGYYWGSWGSCGSSGGYWGSCGSSGGYYYGSCGSSGGSWGSSGGSSGGAYAPVRPGAPTPPGGGATPTPPAPSEPAAAPGQSTMIHPTYGPMRNSALLSVKVPADAKVFVNDRATTSTGADREYISRDLAAGARYNYEVRAEFTRDGKTVTETKSLQLTAGQTGNMDFSAEQVAEAPATTDSRTTLIVRLPEDAKLYLAGHETKSTGPVREFSTTRLANGSEWNTYAIRAVVERDGRQQVREENISLKAGESREVTISFDSLASEKVAETASR